MRRNCIGELGDVFAIRGPAHDAGECAHRLRNASCREERRQPCQQQPQYACNSQRATKRRDAQQFLVARTQHDESADYITPRRRQCAALSEIAFAIDHRIRLLGDAGIGAIGNRCGCTSYLWSAAKR